MGRPDPETNPEKGKRRYRFVLFCFAGLILLAAVYGSIRRTASRFSRDFLSPFLRGITLTEEGAFRSAQMLKPKRKLAAEVHVLQRRNLVLESKNLALKAMEEENKMLRAMLHLPKRTGFEPVVAEISGRTAPLWRERFVVNRGWTDGVAKGDAVAVPDETGSLVMAGKITDVSAGTSVVSTVFSGDCRLSVAISTDGSAGGMELPQGMTVPVVKYLPVDGDYRENALVVTSGIPEESPGGIPVATVLSRGKDVPAAVVRDQLYAEINAAPLVRIDTVRTVVIFTRRKGSAK